SRVWLARSPDPRRQPGVGARLASGRRADHRRGAGGEDGQERGARLLEDELHSLRVHDLDGLDVAEEEVGEGVLAELVERMLGIDLPSIENFTASALSGVPS